MPALERVAGPDDNEQSPKPNAAHSAQPQQAQREKAAPGERGANAKGNTTTPAAAAAPTPAPHAPVLAPAVNVRVVGSANGSNSNSNSRTRSNSKDPASDMSVGDKSGSDASAEKPSGEKRQSPTCALSETLTAAPEPTAAPAGATSTAPKRQVRTGEVNCRWLYNQVQASRGMILLDTRTRAAYEDDSIPSALSVPPMANCRTLEEAVGGMLSEQRYLFSAKKRKLRDVVLFGDTVKRSTGDDGSSSGDDQSSSFNWLRQLERLIVEDGLVTSVKRLSDGFLTFKFRYPFYTSAALLDEIAGQLARTKSGTHNLNYPNEILEGFLFLGNMWQAQSKQVVSHLGITHIVNASLDVGNTFESDGVKYLNVMIKDRPEADISAYFDKAYAFIESAKRTQHGRVLVHCTQGISRSATLVIMYLMRSNGWSLVTAVNFAMASRGVVYPNEGFVRALMLEELRLYKGNSIAPEEVDTLLQHQIPDRPVPLQMHENKSENCSHCHKIFSLLEWKHKCSYCRKAFCSKCTSTRLANPEREKSAANGGALDEQRPRRVCQVCVSRLWQINLPRSRKGLQPRGPPRCKHLNVNSLSTFGRTVCISYFEGTEPQVILDVLKTRFGVTENQIIDISRENGEPVRRTEDIVELADEAEVFVSVGKAGNVQEYTERLAKQSLQQLPQQQQTIYASAGTGYTYRYNEQHSMQQLPYRQQQRQHQHDRPRQPRREARAPAGDRFYRERSSSEGTMDSLQQQRDGKQSRHVDAPRTRSFQLEAAGAEAVATSSTTDAVAVTEDPALADHKFRELWKLSFPSMGLIERSALLKIKRPEILMDVMLGMSSLSCGALTLQEFNHRLVELGYADSDREAVVSLLDAARRSPGRALG